MALMYWVSSAQAAPKVVVTIKPIHSIVSAVMDGIAKPELLVNDLSSPHSIAIDSSREEMLAGAELIIWTSDTLEASVKDAAIELAPNAKTLELMSLEGLLLLPFRDEARWKTDKVHNHIRPEYKGKMDPHIWLAPENAKTIATGIAKFLASADPDSAAVYKQNAATFGTSVTETAEKLASDFKSASYKPYIVFHDAYQYYEHQFDLNPIASIVADVDVAIDHSHIDFLREKIKETGEICVFYEPQFTPQVVDLLADGKTATAAPMDSIGLDIEAGPNHYLKLMASLSKAIIKCEFPE